MLYRGYRHNNCPAQVTWTGKPGYRWRLRKEFFYKWHGIAVTISIAHPPVSRLANTVVLEKLR